MFDWPVLDFGCGRGDDARNLQKHKERYAVWGWDPYWPPVPVPGLKTPNKFKTVLCTYVLNVLPTRTAMLNALEEATKRLKRDGYLVVTVRNDRKALKGWTKKGTWQCYVEFTGGADICTASYQMYIFTELAIRRGGSIFWPKVLMFGMLPMNG